MTQRIIIDGHLDLAWNAASFERDLSLSLQDMNAAEAGMTDVRFRGNATVTFPEMREGRIGLCLGTLLARSGPQHKRQSRYQRVDLDYTNQIGAYAAAHAQRSCYSWWEQQHEIFLVTNRSKLDAHIERWTSSDRDEMNLPLGIILSMEGADPITSPDQLDQWYELGLRAIGPVHYGHGRYAAGTAVEGPFTDPGRELLGEMDRLNMALDVTHLCDESMAEALDIFSGTVWASHHNCRSLVPGDRQLSDDQIQRLIKRDAVIGVACDAWMLQPNWNIGETQPESLCMNSLVDHIDHVCQLAGDAKHSAIGSDLDGGFGTEQTPGDLKSIAELQKLAELLTGRGYSDEQIDDIFMNNWLRVFRKILPVS